MAIPKVIVTPVVTVVVPCYNQSQYLPETLDSVLAQKFQKWECIIVNDGSPDNTEEVALSYSQKDSRFKYIFKKNGGLSSARNAGISIALGEYILPLDSDDLLGHEFLSEAVPLITRDESVKVVYGDVEYFGNENKTLILNEYSLEELLATNIFYCTSLFRKQSWDDTGGYDNNMIYGHEDWEFWISILKHGGRAVRIPVIGFYYRIRIGSMLRSMSEEKKKYLRDYMAIKHAEIYVKTIGNFYEFSFYKSYYQKVRSSILFKIYDKIKRVANKIIKLISNSK